MQCLFLQDLSFVLLVLLPWPVSGKFTVIGPQQPTIAIVGEEATFPCHLFPQIDAQDMDVMWFYGESSELVHHYKYRQDYLKYQHQDYKGRTEFLRDDISNGSVALKLHHIRLSDEGKYRCFFESSSAYEEAEYQVHIAGKGSAPHIHLMRDENESLRLVCTSTGWYPEPEVQWRKNQEMLLPQDTMIEKKENGLFSVETSITVSNNSIMNVSCFIGNPLLRQKLEATFSLSEDLFPHNTPRIVIWIVTGVLVSAVILILIFVIWKFKKGKGVNKEEPVSYVSVKVENEYDVNKDELDVYKDEPGVDKKDPVSYASVKLENGYALDEEKLVVDKEEPGMRKDATVVNKDATNINTDRCDWASRTLERIERNDVLEWTNTGNIQKEQRGIEPSSLLHQEVQGGDQKEMEGHLSPSPDTLKRPDVYKEEPGVNKDELGMRKYATVVNKGAMDLQTAQKYRVDITSFAGTARPFRLPRMDGKISQKNNPKVIGDSETLYCVLGKERFTSGQYYWELQVEDTMKWIVGICKDSVLRKEDCEITPGTGFWTIFLKKKNEYWALSNPLTRLHLEVAPKVVGVFLDYEAGFISFYDVTDDSHIYTFQDPFREALRPFIYPRALFP